MAMACVATMRWRKCSQMIPALWADGGCAGSPNSAGQPWAFLHSTAHRSDGERIFQELDRQGLQGQQHERQSHCPDGGGIARNSRALVLREGARFHAPVAEQVSTLSADPSGTENSFRPNPCVVGV